MCRGEREGCEDGQEQLSTQCQVSSLRSLAAAGRQEQELPLAGQNAFSRAWVKRPVPTAEASCASRPSARHGGTRLPDQAEYSQLSSLALVLCSHCCVATGTVPHKHPAALPVVCPRRPLHRTLEGCLPPAGRATCIYSQPRPQLALCPSDWLLPSGAAHPKLLLAVPPVHGKLSPVHQRTYSAAQLLSPLHTALSLPSSSSHSFS